MRRLLFSALLTLCVVGFSLGPAWARDICVVDSTGALHLGLFVYGMAPIAGQNFTAVLVTDVNFNGRGYYDGNGDFEKDGEIAFTKVDCRTVRPSLKSREALSPR